MITSGAVSADNAQILHSCAARVSGGLASRAKRPARLPSISPACLLPSASRRHDLGPACGLYTGMSGGLFSHVLVSVSHDVVCKKMMISDRLLTTLIG